MTFFTLTSTFINIFFPLNSHLNSHGIFFANAFNSFIPAIMLDTPRFKSSILFGTHTLLDKSLSKSFITSNASI